MQQYNIDFIILSLSRAGWKPVRSIDPWIIIPVETGDETYYLSLCYYENEKILFVKGLVLNLVEKMQEEVLMEFIQTGNQHLSITNFEYDFQNKELICKSGIYFNSIELTAQLIHNLVYEIYDNVKQYKPLVQLLFQQQKTVAEIFEGK